MDLLPLRSPSRILCCNRAKSEFSCLEITEREFVVLTPTLWDVLSSLLDQGMEPR